MPGSHFDRKLYIQQNGHALFTSGPYDSESDMRSIRVFAVVTQAPKGDCVEDGEPPAAICHGEVHLGPDELAKPGTQGTWKFHADAEGTIMFEPGWARGTALALVTKTNGDIETYTWSEWVCLVGP
jgi:hypothetical protein